jgi:Coenzyme PQQ synthesis protein D (PqqD)
MFTKSRNRRDAPSVSCTGRVLSRADFLAALTSGAAAMLYLIGRRWQSSLLLDRQRASGPLRNTRMVAVAEPQGTLLVTENGQGVEADLGCRLNPVAREIWLLANGQHSIEEIAGNISRQFAIPYEVALEDATAFVGVMVDHRLFSMRP